MKLVITYILICLLFISKAQTFQWAKQMGGIADDFGFSITTDAAGNVYTTGRFEATSDFDPGLGVFNLTSNGGADIFISKLDANGNFLWARSFGNIGDDAGNSIKVDRFGNTYVTGFFCWTVDFDPSPSTYTISAAGSFDSFIIKLDVNGNFVWTKAIGGTAWDEGSSIVIDTLGNVYSTGYFNGTADFDPNPSSFTMTTTSFSGNTYISKLDFNGNFVWAKQFSGASNHGQSINIDVSGNIYTTGYFGGTVDFDPSPTTFTLFALNGFVFASKLDSNGDLVWVKNLFGNDASSLNLDNTGNIYITANNGDMLLHKLYSDGNTNWTKIIGGPDMDKVRSATLDYAGNIYIVGDSNGKVDFDPGPSTYTLVSIGSTDIFILKLDLNGNFVGVVQLGGPSQDFGYSITCSPLGDIYTTGFFSETVDFDFTNGILNFISSPSGYHDVFVHKMGPITGVGLFENNLENNLYIFPNPTTGNIKYVINKNVSYDYFISDISGKILKTGTLNNGLDEINLSSFLKGIYFITISNNGQKQSKKIIVN